MGRKWDASWKWAHRIEIVKSLGEIPILKTVLALFSGAIMGIWSYLDKWPGSAIALSILAGFVGLVWAWNGILWMKTRNPRATEGKFFIGRWQIGLGGEVEESWGLLLRQDESAERQVANQPAVFCRWEYRNGQAVIQSPLEKLMWVLRCTPDGTICLENQDWKAYWPDSGLESHTWVAAKQSQTNS